MQAPPATPGSALFAGSLRFIGRSKRFAVRFRRIRRHVSGMADHINGLRAATVPFRPIMAVAHFAKNIFRHGHPPCRDEIARVYSLTHLQAFYPSLIEKTPAWDQRKQGQSTASIIVVLPRLPKYKRRISCRNGVSFFTIVEAGAHRPKNDENISCYNWHRKSFSIKIKKKEASKGGFRDGITACCRSRSFRPYYR